MKIGKKRNTNSLSVDKYHFIVNLCGGLKTSKNVQHLEFELQLAGDRQLGSQSDFLIVPFELSVERDMRISFWFFPLSIALQHMKY